MVYDRDGFSLGGRHGPYGNHARNTPFANELVKVQDRRFGGDSPEGETVQSEVERSSPVVLV